MGLTIRAKADTVATFRFISVYLVEMLARWVPATPELEAKAVFGRHIWELAQHADALGKRTAELRTALHSSRRPTAAYAQALEACASATGTAERLDGFYEALLPDLEARYRRYLEETDHLLDEPTVRIIERVLPDLARMHADAARVRAERPDLGRAASAWTGRIAQLAGAHAGFVDFRPPAEPGGGEEQA